jgi:hypothetical protein
MNKTHIRERTSWIKGKGVNRDFPGYQGMAAHTQDIPQKTLFLVPDRQPLDISAVGAVLFRLDS